jgi:enoyl-[acyl-carrier protein] reductase I
MAVSLYDWFKALFDEDLFADDARIISFTSEGARKVLPGYAAVSAAKASLEAISRNIASEFAPYGIRANCIQAGTTDTASLRMIPNSEKIKEVALKRNPFTRLTRADDVANAVYLLCKDEAAWINGCVIPVDGGEHLS